MKIKLIFGFLVAIAGLLVLGKDKKASATICIPPPQPVDIYLICKEGICKSPFYTYTDSKVCSKYVWLKVNDDDKYDQYVKSIYKRLDIKKDGIYLLSVELCLDNKPNESCLKLKRELSQISSGTSDNELINLKNNLQARSETEHLKADKDEKRDTNIQIAGFAIRWLIFSLVPFILTIYLALKKSLKVLIIFGVISFLVQNFVQAVGDICINCGQEVLSVMGFFYRLWTLSLYGQVLVIFVTIIYKLAKRVIKS